MVGELLDELNKAGEIQASSASQGPNGVIRLPTGTPLPMRLNLLSGLHSLLRREGHGRRRL